MNLKIANWITLLIINCGINVVLFGHQGRSYYNGMNGMKISKKFSKWSINQYTTRVWEPKIFSFAIYRKLSTLALVRTSQRNFFRVPPKKWCTGGHTCRMHVLRTLVYIHRTIVHTYMKKSSCTNHVRILNHMILTLKYPDFKLMCILQYT